jgi:hypothetical protein
MKYIEGKHKLTEKIVIKRLTIVDMARQFVERVGWVRD